jgi:hypothetical protein
MGIIRSKFHLISQASYLCEGKSINIPGERTSIMNEGLIITLLVVNIALSGAALLGVFVVLGMIKGKEE